jgi:hypothetical protein
MKKENCFKSKWQQKWIEEALAANFRRGSLARLRILAAKAKLKAQK